MKKPVIIFDADDTLWETQPIYRSVIEDFYNILEQQGFQRSSFHPLFNLNNEEHLRIYKLSKERLGKAMVATYEAMCKLEGVLVKPSIIRELLELAKQVYIRVPQPAEGLYAVLTLLSKDFELFLYSGGDEKTQIDRLRKLEIQQFFKAFLIVTEKNDATLSSILQTHDLDPGATWIVGNSPRFEINPGLRLGLNCIWMYTNFWRLDLEDVSTGKTFVAFSLREALNILNYGTGFGPQGYSWTASESQEAEAQRPLLPGYNDMWVVGTSPKWDVNPASNFTANIVWIPTSLSRSDIEPFNSKVFVAFSSNGAARIIRQWSDDRQLSKVKRRLHTGMEDMGRSMIVD